MSKDPTRNIDRYKIRGGQMNPFEFHQNQGAVSEQQHEHGNWAGGPPENLLDLPPDKAKAERIRQLLAKHGESVPQADGVSTEEHPVEKRDREHAGRDSEIAKDKDLMENVALTKQQPNKPKVRVQSQKAPKTKTTAAKSAIAKKEDKPIVAPKSVKASATTSRQSSKTAAPARSTKSTKKASTSSSVKQTASRKSKTGTSARSSAVSKTASARGKTTGKATTRSTTTKRTAAPKRAKASAGKSR